MEPGIAAAILFIGMEEGWFTGIDLDDAIDDAVDGDEFADFVRARRIVNGTDRAEKIARHAVAFLSALTAASKPPAVKRTA
jgi:putative chitinase